MGLISWLGSFQGPSGLKHVDKRGVATYKQKDGSWKTRGSKRTNVIMDAEASEPVQLCKYMNNGAIDKLVPLEDVSRYQALGWTMGKRITLTNGVENKLVPFEEVEKHLLLGWVVGKMEDYEK
ncbi:MAG: hypothetical protein LBL09_01015 [Oscillospiraceae bacterium]|jgi:hypothetical protein|nr:hypothetical protein [Oscillospiraceae bacterium]